MKTNHLSKILVVSVITLLGFAVAGTISIATTQNKESNIQEKVSTEANTAMRDLRWARVSLFEGQPEAAKTYLDGVKKNLETAKKHAPEMVNEKSDYVPIDAWLVLSENFVATPEKSAKIKEANENLKNGDKGKAVEVLRTADIGVSVGTMLMPLDATMKHVDAAIQLMSEHKYYEANLALKGAEDGVVVDSIMLAEPVTPASADKAVEKKTDNKTSTNTDETKKG